MLLTLAEDIVLLGMDDDKGTIVLNASPNFPVCVGAAMLIDLYINGDVKVDAGKLKKKSEPEIGFLKQAYSLLDDTEEPTKALKKITDGTQPIPLVLDRLYTNRVLSKETKKVLFIKKDMFPTENPDPENATRYSLFQTVFEGEKPDTRTTFLLYLVKAGNLISEVFRSRKNEAADSIDGILRSAVSEVLSPDDERFYNSLVSAMQKRMMVAV